MKVYLDSCCYNRPFDDTIQERIRLEADAVIRILRKGEAGKLEIIGSEAIRLELRKMTDPVKRQRVLDLYEVVQSETRLSESVDLRSQQIMEMSKIRRFDSLHIASAEAAGADVMLTTDDKLEKMASRLDLYVRVMNPMKYLVEILYGGE